MKPMMLKRVSLLVMMICVTGQLFAAKRVVVDPVAKSITVNANFLTFSPITETLKQATTVWNKSQLTCPVKYKGVTADYTVKFNLTVGSADETLPTYMVNVIPDEASFCMEKDVNGKTVTDKMPCCTDGKTIAIKEQYKNETDLIAQQIGYVLGFKHKQKTTGSEITAGLVGFDIQKDMGRLVKKEG